MQEIWKDIKGYEGLYKVSNLGRVKSVERVCKSKFGSFRRVSEKIRKVVIGNTGYYEVTLNKKGKRKTFKIHQLVAINFLNHKPCGYNLIVDHINNDQLDNKVENLQITTQRVNASKDRKNKTSKYTGVSFNKGTNKWISRITISGSEVYLGLFNCETSAHLAYQKVLYEQKEM